MSVLRLLSNLFEKQMFLCFRGKKRQKDKKPYPAFLIIITSSEQIHVTVHVGTNMLMFDDILTISPQMSGGQLCSRSDTEEIKYLNYNIKYLSYNLVFYFIKIMH